MRLVELAFDVWLTVIKVIWQIAKLLSRGFSLCREITWSSHTMSLPYSLQNIWLLYLLVYVWGLIWILKTRILLINLFCIHILAFCIILWNVLSWDFSLSIWNHIKQIQLIDIKILNIVYLECIHYVVHFPLRNHFLVNLEYVYLLLLLIGFAIRKLFASKLLWATTKSILLEWEMTLQLRFSFLMSLSLEMNFLFLLIQIVVNLLFVLFWCLLVWVGFTMAYLRLVQELLNLILLGLSMLRLIIGIWSESV